MIENRERMLRHELLVANSKIDQLEKEAEEKQHIIDHLGFDIDQLKKDKQELIVAYKKDTERHLSYLKQLMTNLDPIWQEVEDELRRYRKSLEIANPSIEELLK